MFFKNKKRCGAKGKKFTLSLSKGFTLIELLVVIAIIGILATIVLINLNTARNKAKDGSIRAALSEIRAAGEIAYDDDSDYRQVCEEVGAAAGESTLSEVGDFDRIETGVDDNLPGAGAAVGTEIPACNESANSAGYTVWVRLNDITKWWCVDSTGISTEKAAAPTDAEPLNCGADW